MSQNFKVTFYTSKDYAYILYKVFSAVVYLQFLTQVFANACVGVLGMHYLKDLSKS